MQETSMNSKGMADRGRHLVLIHGACHGAWCWYKVVPELRSWGHRVTALDMGASGIHSKRLEEVPSFSDYSEPLMEFMDSLPDHERVVLVGHSMGGLVISLAMKRFHEKIAGAVFVAAFMPGPDLSFLTIVKEYHRQLDSYMDCRFEYGKGQDKPPPSALFGPQFLSTKLYQHSPPEDLSLANLLMRPVGLYEESDMEQETAVSKEKYGLVRRAYIVCGRDNVIKEELQRWMIKDNPPEKVMSIPDSDHMAMFSQPQDLCSCLHLISQHYY